MTQPPTVPSPPGFPPPPAPGERPPTPPRQNGSTLLWLGIGVAAVIMAVIGAFAISGSGSAPGTAAPAPTPSVAASTTEVITASASPTAPTETGEPSASAAPTEDDVVIEEVSSNEDMLDQLFQAVLGPSNRGVDRVKSVQLDEADNAGDLSVAWTINENSSAAKVKNGAWTDIKKILQVVQDSGVPVTKITVVGTFSDGGAKEGQVILATYSWSKVKKLDVGSASPSRVVAIADSFQAQPGFR